VPGSHPAAEPPLSEELVDALASRGVEARGEVELRRELERHVDGYNLFRLTRAAARRWKCTYRVLCGAGYYDGQSAEEAYARALLAALEAVAGEGSTT
jgi:hypothetical protein